MDRHSGKPSAYHRFFGLCGGSGLRNSPCRTRGYSRKTLANFFKSFFFFHYGWDVVAKFGLLLCHCHSCGSCCDKSFCLTLPHQVQRRHTCPQTIPFSHGECSHAKEKQPDQNRRFKEQLKSSSLGLTFLWPDSAWHGGRVHSGLDNVGRAIVSSKLKITHCSTRNHLSHRTSRTAYLLPSLLITVKYRSNPLQGWDPRQVSERKRNYRWKPQNLETARVPPSWKTQVRRIHVGQKELLNTWSVLRLFFSVDTYPKWRQHWNALSPGDINGFVA